MFWNQPSEQIANQVHRKSVEILSEVGFCVPDSQTLADLKSAGFITDGDSQMVRRWLHHLLLDNQWPLD